MPRQSSSAPEAFKNRIIGTDVKPASYFLANEKNWRIHPRNQQDALLGSLKEVGWVQDVIVNRRSDPSWGQDCGVETLIDGHLRISLALREGDETPIPMKWVDLLPHEENIILASIDPITAMAVADKEKLDVLLRATKPADAALQQMLSDLAAREGLYTSNGAGTLEDAPEPKLDHAKELQERWRTSTGQLWIIPSISLPGQSHRLICGDSTVAEDIHRLMAGTKAILCHADPPYGMGKEREGVANDNLYGEKLDAFQMAWWSVARVHLEDNASVYIWGNAEDLWRLWYVGGLKQSERLTFRNEITWGKIGAQGIESEQHRMYPTASERCLFFMLGEQGFNNNADNYWEGWEPIRAYLKSERDRLGWDNEKCKRIAGHSLKSGCHWFDASQWMMPTQEVYEAWQQAARDDGFKRDYDHLKRDYDHLKRDYDHLKRDYYATRAYFDNTHDNMTDVWSFSRVVGDERHDHPTPKPVDLVARIVKSSSPDGGVIYDPFVGSGTTLVCAEKLGRVAYGCEIDPRWVAVTLQRLADMGLTPQLVES